MLGGKNKYRPLGYTIVEVMIVLGVSGVMFLVAVNFINGRQSRTAFTEGVNNMASNIQDMIEQVKSGKYSDADVSCNFTGAGISFVGPTRGQGANSTCVFLGKMIYFSYDPSNRDSSYEVFTLAGGRIDSNGNPFTSPWAAYATVVDTPDLTTRQVIPQNLKVVKVTATSARINTYGIGFFQNPALDSGGQSAGGAETINMYYVSPKLSIPNNNEANAKAEISSHLTNNLPSAGNMADICLSDGLRYADILLGAPDASGASSGNSLVVNVKMDDTVPC